MEIAGSDDEAMSLTDSSSSLRGGEEGAGESFMATNDSVDSGGWKDIFVTLQGTSGSASSADDEVNEDNGAGENHIGTMESGHGRAAAAGPRDSATHHRSPPRDPPHETCESDLLGGAFEAIVLDSANLDDNDSSNMMDTDSPESPAPGEKVERGDPALTDDAGFSRAPTLLLFEEPDGKHESPPQENRESGPRGGPGDPIVVDVDMEYGIQTDSLESSTQATAHGGDQASVADATASKGPTSGAALAPPTTDVSPEVLRSLESLGLSNDSGKFKTATVEDSSEMLAEKGVEVASAVHGSPLETADPSTIQEVPAKNDPMIIDEGESLSDVKRVDLLDLDLLCSLLERTQNAGDALDGQDVLLFIGGTGSGKTTSVLYLAGAQFEEDDSTGFFHYNPIQFPSDNLKEFKVDPGGRSITKTICATRTQLSDGTEVILVDTPGFSDTEGAEYDIANGLGIIRALQRAKSIRPVLVFNSQLFGDRFRSLSETVDTVNRMMGEDQADVDFTKFRYLFTRCEGREVRLIHRKLSVFINGLVEKGGDPARAQLLPLLEDMRRKTTPTAPTFDPLDVDLRLTLLHELWGDSDAPLALNPGDFFQFLSIGVRDKLRGELERRVAVLESDCNSSNFQSVHDNLFLLRRLSTVLPEATEASNRALSFFASYWSRICKIALYQFKSLWQFDLDAREVFRDSLEEVKRNMATLWLVPEGAVRLVSEHAQIQLRGVEDLFHEMAMSCPRIDKSLASKDLHSVQKTLFLLHKMSVSMADLPGGEVVSLQFQREFDRALAHTTSAIREVERWVAADTIDELMKIESPLSFAMDLAAFLKAEDIAESESRAVLEGSINEAINAIDRRLRRCIERVGSVATHLKRSVSDESKVLRVAFADVAKVTESRTFLIAFGQMKELRVITTSKPHFDPSLVRGLDDVVINVLWRVSNVSFKKIKALEQLLAESITIDFEDQRGSLRRCAEAVGGALSLSQAVQSWPSIDVPRRLWERLTSAKSSLRTSLEKLDESAKLFAQGYREALQAAADLSGRMKYSSGKMYELYIELFDHWEAWNALLEATKGHKAFIRSIVSFFDRKSGKPNELGAVISDILSQLQGWIRNAARRLDTLPETNPLLFLQERSEDVCFLLAFFRTPVTLTLGRDILNGSWASTGRLRQQLGNSFLALTEVVRSIKELPGSFLASHKFDRIDLFLRQMDGSHVWVSAVRSITSRVAYSSCIVKDFVSELELEHFSKALFEIPSRESVLFNVAQAVKELAGEVELASLRHLLQVPNEQDRAKRCQDLSSLLSSCSTVEAVSRHLKSESKVATSLYQDLLQRIDGDLQTFHTDLLDLLASFPEDQSSFHQINCFCSCILTFKHCFEDVKPALANTASKIFTDGHAIVRKCLDQFSAKSAEEDCDDFALSLKLLKTASREIPCWTSEVDLCIDKLLNDRVARADKPEEFLLDLSFALRRFCGADSVIAEQLLSDHGKFQGVLTSIFSEATSGQDITYVLDRLDLSLVQYEKLETLYSSFLELYTAKVLDGVAAFRSSKQSPRDFISALVSDSLRATSDESIEFSDRVVVLTSSLFAHWSLTNLSDLVLLEDQTSSLCKYVMKPHAAQVVACWIMLNVHNAEDFHALEPQLTELGTGEGKSIILGVVASTLALWGYSVDVLCYSSYLSGRDQEAFQNMFADFGVERWIWYGTLKGLSHKIIGKGFYGEAYAAIEGLKPANGKHVEFRPSVLLVDEVDIFFGADVFGKVSRNCCTFSPQSLLTLLKSIWSRSATSATCPTCPELDQCLRDLPSTLHPFVNQSIRSMEKAAKLVRSGSSIDYDVVDDRIAYKYFDGVVNHYYGYQTHFHYIKEWESGRVSSDSVESHVELLYTVAVTSYAEYPFAYDAILGITGTLRALNSDERTVLEDMYGIRSYSYIPSVFGRNKLVFAGDDEKGTNVRCFHSLCSPSQHPLHLTPASFPAA